MRYSKLVRDLIPDLIRAKGERAETHIAGDTEYGEKLKDKLREEAQEFQESETIEELADILEVVDALITYHGWTWEEVRTTQADKRTRRGGLTKRIILDES